MPVLKCRTKPVEVEAWFYSGLFGDMPNWLLGRVSSWPELGCDAIVELEKGRSVTISPGWFVVRHGDGRIEALPHDEFKRRYEEVPDGGP